MKLNIELNEEQMGLLINALEINFRIMMKQGNIVADLLAEYPDKLKCSDEGAWNRAFEQYLTSRDNASSVLNALSEILYGNMTMPKDAHRLSDMWSALRHAQYDLHPHDDGYDTRSCPPIQLSDWDMIKVNIVSEEN